MARHLPSTLEPSGLARRRGSGFEESAFLPALLAILGRSIDRLRLPFAGRRRPEARGLWHRVATVVMRRPLLTLVPALGLLVAAGLPFLSIRLGSGGVDQLPQRLEARQAYDTLVRDFPGQDQTMFTVVVDYGSGSPATGGHTAQVGAFATRARAASLAKASRALRRRQRDRGTSTTAP